MARQALVKWAPATQAPNSCGEPLSVSLVISNTSNSALPAPAPPDCEPMVALFLAPKRKDLISNAYTAPNDLSLLSPLGWYLLPFSNHRNASKAMRNSSQLVR